MSQLITIDPVTRIEGHLRVQVEVENGKVKDAWTSGTLFRGFERILRGRKAEDAWLITQRACGVCPTPHGLASAMAIENAYKVELTNNARVVRNLLDGLHFCQDHILHFYHLAALDYVDVTAVARYNGNDAALLDVKSLIAHGDTSPFTPRYNRDYRLPAEINIAAVAHYVEALRIYKRTNEAFALLGGKFPHMMSAVPGGVTIKITPTLAAELLGYVMEIQRFIDTKYLPDVLAVAEYYKDYGKIGAGCGNFLAWGAFPDASDDPKKQLMPRGLILDAQIHQVQDADPEKVTEHIKHSWYQGEEARKPAEGVTEPEFTGLPERPTGSDRYSWLKAPRYDGKPMEVGPLAAMLVRRDQGLLALAARLGIGPSVLARHAARALQTKVIADSLPEWLNELDPNGPTFTGYEPGNGEGHGLTDAPRGSLGHWISIKDGRIENYQMVVPTTWNAGPRDADGVLGPMEQALVGTPVADASQPVEVVRVVRSFDPCIACSVHVVDVAEPEKMAEFRIV